MKNIIKKIVSLKILLFVILTLFACGVNAKNDSFVVEETATYAAYDRSFGFSPNAVSYSMKSEGASNLVDGAIDSSKKIIKTYDISAETKSFDDALSFIRTCADKYEGNIVNSYVDSGNAYNRDFKKHAFFSIRVPADKAASFVNEIGGNINVTYKNENSVDVTDEYDDTEERIKTLKIEEDKLNELMQKAKSVDDMIKIESKLSDIRSELEQITRRLNRLDKQVTYTTISININEVKDLTEVEDSDDFSKENILRLIKKNFKDTKAFIIGIGINIIIHLPAIIAVLILILFVLIIYLIIKSIFNKEQKDNSASNVDIVSSDNVVNNDDNNESENHDDDNENGDELEVEIYQDDTNV